MTDFPPEDLLDHRGRLHRLVIAGAVAIAVGAAVYFVTYSLAGSDFEHGDRAAGRFIFLLTGGAFAASFSFVHWILRRRDLNQWRSERIPRATGRTAGPH